MEPEYRIGEGSRLLMNYTALFYDGVQAILAFFVVGAVINYIITALAIVTFFFWFKIKSVALLDPKIIRVIMKGGAVEMIPFVNAWPSITKGVRAIIKITREQDIVEAEKSLAMELENRSINEQELLAA